MPQAQPLSARDLPDLQYNEALAAKRMKGMGYLGQSQSLTGPKCSSKQPCQLSRTRCVRERLLWCWSLYTSRTFFPARTGSDRVALLTRPYRILVAAS